MCSSPQQQQSLNHPRYVLHHPPHKTRRGLDKTVPCFHDRLQHRLPSAVSGRCSSEHAVEGGLTASSPQRFPRGLRLSSFISVNPCSLLKSCRGEQSKSGAVMKKRIVKRWQACPDFVFTISGTTSSCASTHFLLSFLSFFLFFFLSFFSLFFLFFFFFLDYCIIFQEYSLVNAHFARSNLNVLGSLLRCSTSVTSLAVNSQIR